LANALRHRLVHRNGGRQNAAANVGQFRHLQQSLHGSVLAEGAVQDGEDYIDSGVRTGLRGERRGIPLAVFPNEDFRNGIAVWIQRAPDRFGRAYRYLVLSGAPAIEQRDTDFV
jgi:hypothetical protein